MQDPPLTNFRIQKKIVRCCFIRLYWADIHELLCKLWRKENPSQWKILAPIQIVQDSQNKDSKQRSTSCRQFLDDAETNKKSGEPIQQNVYLNCWKVDDDNCLDAPADGAIGLNRQFWNTCGENIKILTLSRCTISYNPTLIPAAFWKVLPNLENLSLLNCEMELEAKAMQTSGKNAEDLSTSCHIKLRFLQVHNLTCPEKSIPVNWFQITNLFPNLERILISKQHVDDFNAPNKAISQTLKEVDVMLISNSHDKMPNDKLLKLPTEKLSFECGVQTKREEVCSIFKFQARDLKKLCLLRVPFEEPYSSFPCDITLLCLTKLHLWGNMSTNLNFLKLMPNLTQLKWNLSCYDENAHQSPLQFQLELEHEACVLLAESIVEKTNKLKHPFKMEKLKALSFEGGPLSVSSWRKLGCWLPNLNALKATVGGDDELAQIARQWTNLERLELAHKSNVTAVRIVHICLADGMFEKLKSFIWKSCPCEEKALGVLEMCAVTKLKDVCGDDNVVHPWIRDPQEYIFSA